MSDVLTATAIFVGALAGCAVLVLWLHFWISTDAVPDGVAVFVASTPFLLALWFAVYAAVKVWAGQ